MKDCLKLVIMHKAEAGKVWNGHVCMHIHHAQVHFSNYSCKVHRHVHGACGEDSVVVLFGG